MNQGKVVQIIGPVVDVEFERGKLPAIYNALKVRGEYKSGDSTFKLDITLEVQSHLADDTVRSVAMSPPDGLTRGMSADDTGAPISVPVGVETLGRILNVLGEPVDELGPVNAKKKGYRIHRPAPSSRSRAPSPKSSRPASRSWICWPPTPRAAKSASSVADGPAKPGELDQRRSARRR